MKSLIEKPLIDRPLPWRCYKCGVGREPDTYPEERNIQIGPVWEVRLFCSRCWSTLTITERLRAFRERADPEYPWDVIADAIWKESVKV